MSLLRFKLVAPWVHSLKEKRMVVKSVCEKIKNKYNVSVMEYEAQDIHQTIMIAISFLSANHAQADRIKDTLLTFIETHSDAEMTEILFEER